MYEMVQNAYNVTLAGAFVPLVAGVYWKRATTQGALMSIVLGIGFWLGADTLAADALVPPNLVGLFASVIGMLMGTLAPQLIARHGHPIHVTIERHRAAPPGHRGPHHGAHH
jgi:Na+/proline symporter